MSDIALERKGGQMLLRVLPPGACKIPDEAPPASFPTYNELVGLVFDGLPVGVRGAGCARAVAHARLMTLAQAIRLSKAPVTIDKDGIPIPVAPGFEPAEPARGKPLQDPDREAACGE